MHDMLLFCDVINHPKTLLTFFDHLIFGIGTYFLFQNFKYQIGFVVPKQ